jgi:Leucine-rich repeat (LRR) protein
MSSTQNQNTPSNEQHPQEQQQADRDSFLLDQEDDFHKRLLLSAGGRREQQLPSSLGNLSSSFWRSSSSTSATSTKSSARKQSTSNKSSAPQEAEGASHTESITSNISTNKQRNNDAGLLSTKSPAVTNKKQLAKQRAADRRNKFEAQQDSVDFTLTDELEEPSTSLPNFADTTHGSSLERSSSDQSTGSLFYGKSPNSGAVLGKSSSLIFPTGVEIAPTQPDANQRRKLNLLLDQCEAVRFPFKKKLLLHNMSLTAADLPLTDLLNTSLGNSLYKLSLAGNRLGHVPAALVQSLPVLKHLDLSQCQLHQLPDTWKLPKLTRLNLSHNRLVEFPEESVLEGLPELRDLNLYGNKLAELTIVAAPILAKLESLNLGYNDLAYLPDDLDQLTSLKTLKVMNNIIEKIPMRVCDMESLKQLGKY